MSKQHGLILADMSRAKPVRWTVKVAAELLDCSNVASNG